MSPALASLIGCGRTISILSGGEPSLGPETADSGLHKPPPAPESSEIHQPCDLPPTGFGDDLSVRWCQRVSPEPDQVWPGEALARCGFFNLIGDLGLVAGQTADLLYCDSDTDGALRLSTADEAGELSTRSLLDVDCASWANAGALTRLGSGSLLGMWPSLVPDAPGSSSYRYALDVAEIGPQGITSGPWERTDVPDIATLHLLQAPGADPTALLMLDRDSALWFSALTDGGLTVGTPVRALSGVSSLSAALAAETTIVATCEGEVVLRGISSAGLVTFTQAIPDSPCESYTPPQIAANSAGEIAVGFTYGSEPRAVLLGADRQIRRYVSLGADGAGVLSPLPVPAGGDFLVISGGLGVRLDPMGNELGRFHHPALAAHAGQMRDLRVWSDGSSATFAAVWTEAMPVGIHTFTYDVIELSAADL